MRRSSLLLVSFWEIPSPVSESVAILEFLGFGFLLLKPAPGSLWVRRRFRRDDTCSEVDGIEGDGRPTEIIESTMGLTGFKRVECG